MFGAEWLLFKQPLNQKSTELTANKYFIMAKFLQCSTGKNRSSEGMQREQHKKIHNCFDHSSFTIKHLFTRLICTTASYKQRVHYIDLFVILEEALNQCYTIMMKWAGSINQPTNQSINQSIYQSINQSINPFINPLIN